MPPGGFDFGVFWNHFQEFITLISPLFIAWCGWKVTTTEKESRKYRELRERNDALLKEQAEAKEQAQEEVLDNIIKKLEKLEENVAKIDMDRVADQIHKLTDMSNANFAYSQSLSTVLVCLGDVLESSVGSDTASKMREAIRQHQKTEQKIVAQICKIAY